MCGRYYISEDDAAEELRRTIEAVNRRSADMKTGGGAVLMLIIQQTLQ